MRLRLFVLSVLLAAIALTAESLAAQNPAAAQRDCAASFIESRLLRGDPVHLAADDITWTGATLALTGRARLSVDEGYIRAERATIDRVTRKVELAGNLELSVGRDAACVQGRITPPQYR